MKYINKKTGEVKGFPFDGAVEMTEKEWSEFKAEKESVDISCVEYNWAKSELESSDIEIKYHERNSKRAKLTVEQWYDYQEDLRDYASVDDSGDYSTSGDRPTRPS